MHLMFGNKGNSWGRKEKDLEILQAIVKILAFNHIGQGVVGGM